MARATYIAPAFLSDRKYGSHLYPLYTRTVTLCLPSATTKLARSFKDGIQDVQTASCLGAMVAVRFWVCSKQSHKGRRGSWMLKDCSNEAGGRCICIAVIAEWIHIGRPVNKAFYCIHYLSIWAMLLPPAPCTNSVPPFKWPTYSVNWAITVATTMPPVGDHGNPWATMAMDLPPLADLLCLTVPLQQFWWFKASTRVVLRQIDTAMNLGVFRRPVSGQKPQNLHCFTESKLCQNLVNRQGAN